MALPKNTGDMADVVGEYLLSHPEFLNDNPELLSRLNLSHHTGKNVASLIELQVERLRETSRTQQQQIDYLHQSSEQDDKLASHVHNAVLKLVQSTSIKTCYELLLNTSYRHFMTRHLNIFVFTDADPRINQRNIFFEYRDSRLQRMFTELFTRNKALCDSLQAEHLQMLFGMGEPVESTLLIPCNREEYRVLFALGSAKRNVYKQGFELKLLEFLVSVFMLRFNELVMASVLTGK